MDGVAFPPEPWHLSGRMLLLVWSLPADVVADRLPRGLTPVTRRGRTLVGTAWADCQAGGVLAYREVLCAAVVRTGGRPALCITDIWVDSPASRDGGRALWAIPKELATFPVFDGHRFAADLPSGPVARACWTPGPLVPGRWPVRFDVVQGRAGRLVTSRVRSTARVVLGRASMDAEPRGPLGHLAGRTPVRSLVLADFRLRFGG